MHAALGFFLLSIQDGNNPHQCRLLCRGEGSDLPNTGLFGVQNGFECWCPSDVTAWNYKRHGSSENCNIDCPDPILDNNGKATDIDCGGRSAMRVFEEYGKPVGRLQSSSSTPFFVHRGQYVTKVVVLCNIYEVFTCDYTSR